MPRLPALALVLAASLAVLPARPAAGQPDGEPVPESPPEGDWVPEPLPVPDDVGDGTVAEPPAEPAIVAPLGPPSEADLVEGEHFSFSSDDLDELETTLADLGRFEVAATVHAEDLEMRGADGHKAYTMLVAALDAGERARARLVTALRKMLAGEESVLLAPRAAELLAAIYDQLTQLVRSRASYRSTAAAWSSGPTYGGETYGGYGYGSGYDYDAVYGMDDGGESLAQGWAWAAITQRQWMIEKFPDYRGRGKALLALANAYDDQNDPASARATLQLFLCGNRKSEIEASKEATDDDAIYGGIYARAIGLTDYEGCVAADDDRDTVAQAWMQLAEMHQSTTGEADLAVAALGRASSDPRAGMYADALRQLADVQMGRGAVFDAIPPLDDLVVFADKSTDDQDAAHQLRTWAVYDLGRIIALLWRQSSLPDPDGALNLARIYFHAGRNGQPHVRDVFISLGDSLVQVGAIDQAVTVYRHVITTWPTETTAPLAAQKLIDGLVQKGDNAGADEERLAAAQRFGRGTPWREAHPKDVDAPRLVADALWTLAQARYRDAESKAAAPAPQRARDGREQAQGRRGEVSQEASEDPVALYDEAKALYQQYLVEVPDGSHALEANFRIAKLDDFAGRHVASARAMRAVRDQGDKNGRFFESATRAMAESYRSALADAERAGDPVLPAMPDAKALAGAIEAGAGAAIEQPELVAEARKAFDDLAAMVAFGDEAAKARLDAAVLELRYLRLDDARTRFRDLLGSQCQTDAGKAARTHLTALSGTTADDRSAIADLEKSCTASEKTRREELRKRFADAEALYQSGKYDEAARAFYAIYRGAPTDFELADDALYWAAFLLRATGRIRGALTLLDEFVVRPELAASDLYPAALWQRADAHHASFDYERAATEYLELWDLAKSKRKLAAAQGFDPTWNVNAALKLAAESREMDHFYYDRGTEPGAATLFQRYAGEMRKEPYTASDAYVRAAQVYQRAGDATSAANVYTQWKKRHGGANMASYAIDLQTAVAAAADQTGDKRTARLAYEEVVKASRELETGWITEQGAKAQLWLAEDMMTTNRITEFTWGDGKNEKELGKVMDEYGKRVEPVMRAFERVAELNTRWTIAALVRQGDIRRIVINAILSAPIPAAFFQMLRVDSSTMEKMTPEERAKYAAEALRDQLAPFLGEAGDLWQKAIDESEQRGIVDHWSKLARRYLAETFPERALEVMSDEILVSEDAP